MTVEYHIETRAISQSIASTFHVDHHPELSSRAIYIPLRILRKLLRVPDSVRGYHNPFVTLHGLDVVWRILNETFIALRKTFGIVRSHGIAEAPKVKRHSSII